MTIRKTGSATGQVTEVEPGREEPLVKQGAAAPYGDWHPLDDDLLDAENRKADADEPDPG